MRIATLLAFAAFVAPLAAQQRITDAIYPADAPVLLGEQIWQACRVVDAVTGKPIAGAELLLVDESPTPVGGVFWSKRVVTSDADGFVRVRSDDVVAEGGGQGRRKPPGWHSLLLRAKGYGPSMVHGVVPSLVWPLSPALDLPVELRDWQGLPIANARVGLCLGCGHTPDVANAVTDQKGLAVLRGVDPNTEITDLYPEGPDLGIAEYGRVDWAPGDVPALVNVLRGYPVRGKLLDHDGKPKAGLYVGSPQVHRGPWAKTGEDGSFVLEGAAPDAELVVLLGRREVRFERPDTEQPFVLQLPKVPDPKQGDDAGKEKEGEGEGEGRGGDPRRPGDDNPRRPPPPILVDLPALPEGPLSPVELQVVDPAGQPIEALEITTLGPLPRRRAGEESVRQGKAAFERLPGKYEVVGRSPVHERVLGSFEVEADKPCQAKVTAVPFALLPVRAEAMASLGSISVRTESGSREVTADFAADGTASVAVPNHEPFCFVVGNDTGVNVVRTSLAEAKAAAPFVLRGVQPTKVKGELVTKDGKPVPAAVGIVSRADVLRAEGAFDPHKAELQPSEDGRFELASKDVGLAFLVAVPKDPALPPLVQPLSLPRLQVDGRHDAGRLTVGAPAVTVHGADGKPLAAVAVGLTRVGWHDVRARGPAFVTDADGLLLAPPLHAGDAVVVPADHYDIEREAKEGEELVVDLPFRTVLTGNGPWDLKVPAGELAVELTEKGGKPALGRVFVGDRCVAVNGKARLRQVPLGKCQLVVAGIDRKTVLVDVEVKAGAAAVVKVEMVER